MKTSRHFISAAAEFTARVQNGENDFKRRYTHFRVFSGRYSSSVVGHFNDISLFDGNGYIFAVTGKGFVYRVVNYFIHEVVKTAHGSRSDIHTGSLSDGFKSFQNLYLTFVVPLDFFRHTIYPFISVPFHRFA